MRQLYTGCAPFAMLFASTGIIYLSELGCRHSLKQAILDSGDCVALGIMRAMLVYVERSGNIRVSKDELRVFHGYIQIFQDRCCRMPEGVNFDARQSGLFCQNIKTSA